NTGRFDSVYIGKQGTGGVTFFNGTIVNSTTNDGVDNPVTFGDNVRIDGEIWRGEQSGPFAGADAKDMPVKVNDDLNVAGKATISGTLSNPTVDAKANKSDVDVALAGKANSSDLGNYVAKSNPTWNAVTRTSAVPMSGMTPVLSTYLYANSGSALLPTGNAMPTGFTAPIHLPQGSVVKKIEITYICDQAGYSVAGGLKKYALDGNPDSNVVTKTSTQCDGLVHTEESTTVTNGTIDNTANTYYVAAAFTGDDHVALHGVQIEYEQTQP
ncbi:hypothetical protein KKH43_06410, partial [Patescibacteria group bacterium]|nr:hypothetical protein [Patescibacteria group bacterium]